MDSTQLENIEPTTDTGRIDLSKASDFAYLQDDLFAVSQPWHDPNVGYRGTSAAGAAGISYRQLDYWDRTALVQPSVRGASGSGTQRLYSFRDILVLKLVKNFLDTGVSLQQIRVAITELRAAGISDLAKITLFSDGAKVYLFTSADEIIDLMDKGQGVFGISVGKVLNEVEATLAQIDPSHVEEMDELTLRRLNKKAV
ncbi:MAG: MerR family transcriptional regulator [Micrococcales bacterium]|jgi:DNA-binding transcriptional MerR regulator|nr:MerR family transcriptional regulator [Actinomycetota bacterium]NCA07290.1 MerR family transcriptional regulator [Micrococcales bacterium]